MTFEDSSRYSASSNIFMGECSPPRRILVIGHRGVGKTSFLQRLRAYSQMENRKCLAVDLDEEIVRRAKWSIEEIFAKQGEQEFRRLEEKTLNTLVSEFETETRDVFIALGAGYSGCVPEGWRCVWLRRLTDETGRVFIDRPRLNDSIAPLLEYEERRKTRDRLFRERADLELTIPEGLERPLLLKSEADLVFDRARDAGGALTVLPRIFASEARAQYYFSSRIAMGFDFFELRDDLLSPAQLEYALATLPREKIIFSFRQSKFTALSARLVDEFRPASVDWAFELGEIPDGIWPSMISFHSRDIRVSNPRNPGTKPRSFSSEKIQDGQLSVAFTDFLENVSQLEVVRDRLIKVAVPVESFAELEAGHQWFLEDRSRRAFLPSGNGRWSWYRLLLKGQLPLNFVREGDGSSPDQPILLDWMRFQKGRAAFAAVLGDPILQSRTPLEQFTFFDRADTNTLAIQVTTADWENGALRILQNLGLRFAAVTAPLKELAFQVCTMRTQEAELLHSANTLAWTNEGWAGANTDQGGLNLALRPLKKELDWPLCASMSPLDGHFDHQANEPAAPRHLDDGVAVWGGGGTLQMLTFTFPQARFFRRAQVVSVSFKNIVSLYQCHHLAS